MTCNWPRLMSLRSTGLRFLFIRLSLICGRCGNYNTRTKLSEVECIVFFLISKCSEVKWRPFWKLQRGETQRSTILGHLCDWPGLPQGTCGVAESVSPPPPACGPWDGPMPEPHGPPPAAVAVAARILNPLSPGLPLLYPGQRERSSVYSMVRQEKEKI